MKEIGSLLAAGGILFAAWQPVVGAEVKVAVVNMELVMKAFPETQSGRLILEQQVEEFEAEQKEMLKELDQMSGEFREARDQSRNQALSEEAREKHRVVAESKIEQLRQRENEIKENVAMRRKQLQDQQLRMRRRIVKKLREIVAEHCLKNGIALVLDGASPELGGAEAVVYFTESLDITDAVLALIGKEKPSDPPGE